MKPTWNAGSGRPAAEISRSVRVPRHRVRDLVAAHDQTGGD